MYPESSAEPCDRAQVKREVTQQHRQVDSAPDEHCGKPTGVGVSAWSFPPSCARVCCLVLVSPACASVVGS